MIKYEEIKETLKNKSFNIYKDIKLVEKDSFNLKYIDAKKSHNLFFSELDIKMEDWINSLNEDLELKNLESLPEYAFIHYISKKLYPEDYYPEVGVALLDEEKLKHHNIDKEEYISKMGDFSFDNFYEDVLFEIFGLDFDKEKTNLIDRTEMFQNFKDEPFMNYYNIVEKWENIYSGELCLSEKAFLIALGQATYEIICKSIK